MVLHLVFTKKTREIVDLEAVSDAAIMSTLGQFNTENQDSSMENQDSSTENEGSSLEDEDSSLENDDCGATIMMIVGRPLLQRRR